MQPLGETFAAWLDEQLAVDPALAEHCRHLREAQLARNAYWEAHRPEPTLDGKPFAPRLRTDFPVPTEPPPLGPSSTWLHDGTELRGHGPGYECRECNDAGFVTRDVPVGDPDFGRAVPCRCQVENPATRAARVQTRRRRSGMPEELYGCTLDTFERRRGTGAAWDALQSVLAAVRTHAERPRWLAFWGGTGRGKTHLLAGATQALLPLADVCWAELPEFLAECKAHNFADDEALTQRAVTAPVLVLDRVGGQPEGAWGTEKTLRILMRRYEDRRFTLLGLEVDGDELERWSPRLASRLADRGLCVSAAFTCDDYRRRAPRNGVA